VVLVTGMLAMLAVVSRVGPGAAVSLLAAAAVGIGTRIVGTHARRVHYHRPHQQGQESQAHEDVGQANEGCAHS
jgi:hypothetical protein